MQLLKFVLPLLTVVSAAQNASLLVAGDSWGTDIFDSGAFKRKLNDKKCPFEKANNIAVPGTQATDWDHGASLAALVAEAKTHDYLWLTLMGNDALDIMPQCASSGKTAPECGDQLVGLMLKSMGTILDSVHKANPNMKISGFGYDVMFGGPGCSVAARTVFPQCWKTHNATQTPIECFNTQFVRIQGVWEQLAKGREDFVTVLNVLGTTQVAGGDSKATIGNPDLASFGPAKYWPDSLGCIHPSITGGDNSGAMLIMEQYYEQYWSKELGC